MTISELKYLIAANELADKDDGAKLSSIAQKMNVSKVSVYRGMERLVGNEYITRNDKKIVLTTKGRAALAEYRVIISFISKHLECHCNVSAEVAYNDALGVACAFSDVSRKGVVDFVESVKKGRIDHEHCFHKKSDT